MMLDGFTVIVIAATLNIITIIITVAYCSHLVNKKIIMLIDAQDGNKGPKKNIKKSPANVRKSKLAAKKNDEEEKVSLFDKLFGLADNFDEEDDKDDIPIKRSRRRYKDTDYVDINDDVSDDELHSWISESELDSIANEVFDKGKKKPIAPLRGTKVVAFDKPRVYYFTNPQDLVNYIANKDNRTVYDTKKNRIQKIKSFDIDYSGGLLIYYDYYDLPDYFEPGRFAKVS